VAAPVPLPAKVVAVQAGADARPADARRPSARPTSRRPPPAPAAEVVLVAGDTTYRGAFALAAPAAP
jgi:hypothetical protein